MGGPSPALDGQDVVWIGEVPNFATLVITAASEGDTTTLVINEARFTRTMLAGETTENQRDALLVLLAASIEPVVCTASGVASIVVTPEYLGDLQHVSAVEGCTATSDVDLREVVRGIRTWRYRVQLHAGSDSSDTSSGWIDIDLCSDALLTVLSSPAMTRAANALQVQRFGPRPAPQRASVQSGARIEQRVFFDVNLSMITRWVASTDPIGIDATDTPAIVLS